jgi:alpha-galactosidase
MTDEEASFTLVTSLLGSFYLSGHLDRMTASQRARVAEAVAVAKRLRPDIGRSRPHWPLGLPGWSDDVVALGLSTPGADLISVWCRAPGERPVELALPHLAGRKVDVETIFPRDLPAWGARWNAETGTLALAAVGPNRARTLRVVTR